LPTFNGSVEVGVACGVDPKLKDAEKLRIALRSRDGNVSAAINDDIMWRADQVIGRNDDADDDDENDDEPDDEPAHETGSFLGVNSEATAYASAILMYDSLVAETNHEIRVFKTRVAYGAIVAGLVSFTDGDVVRAPAAVEILDVSAVAVAALLTVADVGMDLSIAISTKVGYWAMNHHTGSGRLQGYPLKVLTVKRALTIEQASSAEWTNALHTAGHWLSTKITLSALGIEGITRPQNITRLMEVVKTDDLRLRVTAAPAGTHKHAIAAAIARRLVKHNIAPLAHVLAEMGPVMQTMETISRNPARFHIGAHYLVGGRALHFSDDDAKLVLGRLSSFALVFLPGSSLCRSPHVKDEIYEDFDSIWKGTLTSVKAAFARRDPTFASTFAALAGDKSAGLNAADLDTVNRMFNTNVGVFNVEAALVRDGISVVESADLAAAATARMSAAVRARVAAAVENKRAALAANIGGARM
jgi:hypothetical protein